MPPPSVIHVRLESLTKLSCRRCAALPHCLEPLLVLSAAARLARIAALSFVRGAKYYVDEMLLLPRLDVYGMIIMLFQNEFNF